MSATTSVLGGVVRRREDPALIQGTGLYTDDLKLNGMLHAAFVRSPYAHARITSIDSSEAEAMEGVHAIFTIDDVRHLGPLVAQVAVGKARPLLADGMVNHAGEAVAMVIAADRYTAQDAADSVFVEYDVLDPVVDLKKAVTDEVLVHDDLESNTLISWVGGPFGDEDAIAQTRQTIQNAKDREPNVPIPIGESLVSP